MAADYHRWRPDYPPAAVDWIVAWCRGRDAAEIGAGTGKATAPFVEAGFTVTAVEPDTVMAEVGAAAVPGARWVVATAEDWDTGRDGFDLIYGAQSWHWVDRAADARLAGGLRPGGVMAWLWNHPRPGDLFGDIYARYIEDTAESVRQRLHRRDTEGWLSRLGDIVSEVETATFAWTRPLSADDYVALIGTYTDHILLPDDDRENLLDEIHQRMIDTGGDIDLEYTTAVYLGRRPT